MPASFQAIRSGSAVVLSWDTPSGGTPATSYAITVSGSFTGTFPTAERSFAAGAPPGTYNVSVRAVNACGSGPSTAFQTVVIP